LTALNYYTKTIGYQYFWQSFWLHSEDAKVVYLTYGSTLLLCVLLQLYYVPCWQRNTRASTRQSCRSVMRKIWKSRNWDARSPSLNGRSFYSF